MALNSFKVCLDKRYLYTFVSLIMCVFVFFFSIWFHIMNRSFYLFSKYMWHLSVSKEFGSAPKELHLSSWWQCSICYGCTGPQDFLSSLPLFTPAISVRCISSTSNHWQHLPSSQCPCPSSSCLFCRHLWSKDEVAPLASG